MFLHSFLGLCSATMTSVSELSARFYAYNKMYSFESRLQTFADWPFREECHCTPEMMAKVGFVHCPSENEPDVACCFFCLLELEGWEPEDNPLSEHMKRSPHCGFLVSKKDFDELTVAEFFHLEQDRLRIYIRKICHQKIAFFRDEIDKIGEYLNMLFGTTNEKVWKHV